MNTIVIPVGKDRPEDDVLSLVDIFKSLFPGQQITVRDALVIDTDIPQAAGLFKAIAGVEIQSSNGGSPATKKYACIECGAPTSKKNGRCRNCAQKMIALKKKGMLPVGEQLDE